LTTDATLPLNTLLSLGIYFSVGSNRSPHAIIGKPKWWRNNDTTQTS